MALTPGTRLGPYEILTALGAGGMGEVYRAKDPRLGRDVAVKVLPASLATDPDRLRRFEQEARAASSLDHPHVAAIHDIGTHEGTPYIVSELLEGGTLREKLGTPLPSRRVVEYALQIAQGLSAAHEKGIVHRDLKPENLFVTRDGRVKILDFGLAKLTQPSFGGGVETGAPTMTRDTDPGTVMGTVGYMSPEQVRGKAIDHRSDIFAFGAILYEMLTGRRAFKGDTNADTMTAILKEEPPEISATQPLVPPALDRIVRHCLEKDAEARFQSARDLAFDLEALSVTSAERIPAAGARPGPRSQRAVAALAAIALAVGAYLAGRRATSTANGSGVTSLPSFHRLTYQRGTIRSARFAPDGQTIVYGAAWAGQPIRLFMTRGQGGESTPVALPDADILSISPSGEMAVSIGRRFDNYISEGTLAQAGLLGGTPREILENVREAEWAPDAKGLAVVRKVGTRERLEYPADHVLYETDGYISHPRFSRNGDRIAFLDHPAFNDDRGWVSVVDLAGRKTRVTKEYDAVAGLAWSPLGDELWFSGNQDGVYSLLATTLVGRERVVWRGPGSVWLMDVSPDGRTLLCETVLRGDVFAVQPGGSGEQDLSFLGWTVAYDVSADGRVLILNNFDQPRGSPYGVYLRRTDGSPAVRLGEGYMPKLSPDGKWALTFTPGTPTSALLLPTGPGQPRTLHKNDIEHKYLAWFPDGRRILVVGSETGHAPRTYVQDLDSGTIRAITPEGTHGWLVSPDGRMVTASEIDGSQSIYPVDGGEPRPIPDLEKRDAIIRWAADGRALFVTRRDEVPTRVYRFDLATGQRTVRQEISVADRSGMVGDPWPLMTPDGQVRAYNVGRRLTNLYLVEGLK